MYKGNTMAGIIVHNSKEVARRQAEDPTFVESGVSDPIAYIRTILERIADEAGIVARFEVDEKGKGGIRFTATVDPKKLRAMRMARPRGE